VPDPSPAIGDLLAVEPLGDDVFRHDGRPADGPFAGLFGGLPLALALRAAGATVPPDRPPHSLHAYFLRPGSSTEAMELRVERDTDGRSFSARRVTVSQRDRVIFTMAASFHVAEEGPELQLPAIATDVPDPDDLPAEDRGWRPASVVEVRNVGSRSGGELPDRAWGRANGPMPEDPLLHACVLVHFSDLYTGLPPTPGTGDTGGPSLDHAFWFHRLPRMDDWVLMQLDPVAAGRGRGLYTGTFHDRRGRLLASLAQEMLYSTSRPSRVRPPWVEVAEKQPPPHRLDGRGTGGGALA
jgi:acyl-CoA thioesterase-2